MTKFWAVDGANDEWEECDNVEDALRTANTIVSDYGDNCDPEWPMGVEDVVVLFGDRDPENDEWEGCKILYCAKEVNVRDPDEGDESGVEYYCDYEMVKVQ